MGDGDALSSLLLGIAALPSTIQTPQICLSGLVDWCSCDKGAIAWDSLPLSIGLLVGALWLPRGLVGSANSAAPVPWWKLSPRLSPR